jgi:hypothetical protein
MIVMLDLQDVDETESVKVHFILLARNSPEWTEENAKTPLRIVMTSLGFEKDTVRIQV